MNCSYFFVLTAFLTAVAVIKSSNAAFECSTVDFGSTPAPVDTYDGDVEANTTARLQNVWTGRLSLSSQNFTLVEINWDRPTVGDSLCAYSIHYYPQGVTQKSKHLTFRVPPRNTNMLITGLDTGTTYHIYVEALFNKPVPGTADNIQLLKSWLLIVTTLGYGPANPCNCHPAGTVDGRIDNCDRMTGQCQCQDAPLTNGLKCDSCPEKTYMDKLIGCTVCDQCDHVGSTGNCLPAPEEGMNCVCNTNFTGKHCRDCNRGFYRVGETAICKPCNCSGNENKAAENYCNSDGTCTACDSYTTGDHCETCLDGYKKDFTNGSCYLADTDTTGHKVGIAILVILIIVASLALIFIIVRKLNRRRRQLQGSLKSSGSGVNFSTLVEEPDLDFNRGSRKLHIGGTSSNA